MPVTLSLLEPGAIFGDISLLRNIAGEPASASTEVIGLTIESGEFLRLLQRYLNFAQVFQNRPYRTEIFDIVAVQPEIQAYGDVDLKELAQNGFSQARVDWAPRLIKS
ncbi:toxin secretion ABC transporter ATP-binding protein [Richelia intracellularis]|nr:toxin secretion ABC transporter ATP-binding protein [Richelia intracellularis]